MTRLKDHDRVQNVDESRRTFKSTARWKAVTAAIRAGRPDCALCGLPIRYDLAHPDPLSFSVDHKEGYPVEQQVGKLVWEARRILTSFEGCQAAHLSCNSRDSARRGFPNFIPTQTRAEPEPEPLTPVEYVNQKMGAHDVFYVNERTILSPDWIAA